MLSLPLKEHPYGPLGLSGQLLLAPSARYGTPDDFRYLIDYLHQRGIGVIMVGCLRISRRCMGANR